MKIILDPQIFNAQNYGGISRYYTEIFSVLIKKKELCIIIPLNDSNNVYFNDSILSNIYQKSYSLFLKIVKNLHLNRIFRPYEIKKKRVNKMLSKQNYDLFVPTYYDSYFIDYIGTRPFVLTVYDMIHELFPEYFIDDKMVVLNKKYLMENATRIIAVSENTKKDIIKIYPHINEAKIDVIYHGCSIKSNNNLKSFLPEKYILFVGARDHYKNFFFFINSVAELIKKDSNLYLICAGGGDFCTKEIEVISKLGLENQIIQKYFKDEELSSYYKNAKCFVFPSLYEGFGIPVLEAMYSGCPVVLARHSSFPEVAGDAGIYYELNNSEDLQNKVYSLIQDDTLRNEYILKGLEQVKKFNWKNAAEECLKVYIKACEANFN